jgi:hypothetical protein
MKVLQVAIVTDNDLPFNTQEPASCLVYLFPTKTPPQATVTEEPVVIHSETSDYPTGQFHRTLTLMFDVSDYRIFQDKHLLNQSPEGQRYLLDQLLLWMGECHE